MTVLPKGALVVAVMPGGADDQEPTYRVGILAQNLVVPASGAPKAVLMDAWSVHKGTWTGKKRAKPFNPATLVVVDDQDLVAKVARGVERCSNMPDAALWNALERTYRAGLSIIAASVKTVLEHAAAPEPAATT